MEEINESEEFVADLEDQVKDPHLKESKLKKHTIKDDEKFQFDSGDYYMQLDIKKKIEEEIDEMF